MTTEIITQAMKVLKPLSKWRHDCHGASLTLVKNGIGNRVARGFCPGVGSQHSWVVVGDDCYEPEYIIDPTLWSYREDVEGIYVGSMTTYSHRPHGTGSIWEWGRPSSGDGPIVTLTPTMKLSRSAAVFLEMIEPLDLQGWAALASAPVGGWPASEIIAAMDDTKELSALVPIDRIGMLTNRNPGGLYLPIAQHGESQ
jgi:hypothetical protein